MSNLWTLGPLALFVALTAGCASTATQTPQPRMVASGTRLVVEVEGGGSVDLGPSENKCEASAPCTLAWDRVAEPVLVAEARPGWRFDHWEEPGASADSPSFTDPDQPHVYRAVFRRGPTQVAKR
jgi:hypothetical protein